MAISFLVVGTAVPAEEEVTFEAADGTTIFATVHTPHDSGQAPFIVLFHQAGSSQSEYDEIVPWLGELGFNAMTVDLRSGGGGNETVAERGGSAGQYADALPDIEAALAFARNTYAETSLIGWGSSYSGGLIIKAVGEQPELADGVIAYSPGDYYGQSAEWLGAPAANVAVPFYLSAPEGEKRFYQPVFDMVGSKDKNLFTVAGSPHGSSALTAANGEKAEQHKADLRQFLERFLQS
ncbi:MAG: alpha/beta hydrolase family protein [Geminicoccaceae bacterium]